MLNQSHWDAASRRFRYRLPLPEKFKGGMVGLASLSLYNSFQNISAANQNNTVSFTFPATFTKNPLTGASISSVSQWVFNWTIPDGYYSVSDLNAWFQQQMVLYKLYAIQPNGNYYYFFSLTNNLTQYKVSMNFAPVKDTSPSSLTLPGDAWTYLGSPLCPSVTISSAPFGLLLGFLTGTYGGGSIELNVLSNSSTAAQISTISSIILGTNLCFDNISVEPSAFYSTAITVGTGEAIAPTISGIQYFSIAASERYEYVEVSIFDQNCNRLNLFDTQACIMLSIIEP